jgi:hypothetical protein
VGVQAARVIEHEDGYRAQFAYPYDLCVYADDETVARQLRDVYAVDVAWHPCRVVEPAAPAADEKEPIVFGPPVADDELLLALVAVAAAEYGGKRGAWPRFSHGPIFHWLGDVREAVLCARGFRLLHPHQHPGYDTVSRQVTEAFGGLVEQGLLESGTLPGRWACEAWRLSAAGRARLRALEVPPVAFKVRHDGVAEVDTDAGLRAFERPRCLFEEEIQAWTPRWVAERRAAKGEGQATLLRFVERRRKQDERLRWSRLHVPDEEVQEAVAEAIAAGEAVSVGFAAIADRLLPGRISKHGRGQWGVVPMPKEVIA